MGSLSRKASPFPDPGKRARPGKPGRKREREREREKEGGRERERERECTGAGGRRRAALCIPSALGILGSTGC